MPPQITDLDGDLLSEVMLCLPPASIVMAAASCASLRHSILGGSGRGRGGLWRTVCTDKWRHCHAAALERAPHRLYASGNGWDSPSFLAGEVGVRGNELSHGIAPCGHVCVNRVCVTQGCTSWSSWQCRE